MNWQEYAHREASDAERSRRKLLDEIRARIFWGEPADDVKTWAMSQDAELLERKIDDALEKAQREFAAQIRMAGRRDLLWGLPLLLPGAALAAWAIWELYWGVWQGNAIGRLNSVVAYILLFVGLAPAAFGGYLTYRGLDRVIFGARAENPHA